MAGGDIELDEPANERTTETSQDPKPDIIEPEANQNGAANGKTLGAAVVDDESSPTKSTRFYLAFFSCLLAIWLVAAELVVVASSLASISEDLGASSNDAYWCGTGYILAQTVSQPIYGSLSEVFGRKVMLQLSIIIFLFATILCSRADSIHWLIGTRVVQGIGGGGIITLTAIITVDMTTVRERGKFFSYISLAYLVGNIGIIMGAAISQLSTWRWIFYMMIPVCVISFIGVQIFLHQSLEKATFKERMGKLDYVGMITLIGSLSSLLIGITSGGGTYPWSDGRVIAPIVVGGVGIIGFGFIERYFAKIPMLPLAVFKDHGAKIAYLNSFCLGVAVAAVVYYLVIYFIAAVDRTLIIAATDMLPAILCSAPGTIVGGILISKMGTFQIPIWLGWAFSIAGAGALTVLKPTSSDSLQEGLQVLVAFGAGLLFPSISIAAQVAQPDELHSVAVNVITFFRSMGQTFGVAIGATVFQNQFNVEVNKYLASGVLGSSTVIMGRDAEAFALQIREFPPEVANIYKNIYSSALQNVWYVVMALNILGLLTSLFVRHTELQHRLTSKQTFKDKSKEKHPEAPEASEDLQT